MNDTTHFIKGWMIALTVLSACSFDEPEAIEGPDASDESGASDGSGTSGGTEEHGDTQAAPVSSTDSGAQEEGSSSSGDDASDGDSGEPVTDWALSFDGDDEAMTSETELATLPPEFTVELWLLAGEEPYHGIILDTRPLGIDEGWVLFIGSPSNSLANQLVIGWFAEDGSTPGLEGPQVHGLEPGWHHLAVTRRADGVTKMFVDGFETVSDTTALPAAPQVTALALGRYKRGDASTGLWWRGAPIDDVRISDVARYDGPFTPARPVQDDDSVLMWRFDEGAGDLASDDVHALDLQLAGPQWAPRP